MLVNKSSLANRIRTDMSLPRRNE